MEYSKFPTFHVSRSLGTLRRPRRRGKREVRSAALRTFVSSRGLAALLFVFAAACGGSSGGGSGSGSTSGDAGAPSSGVSEAHWRTAMAALGSSYAPAPVAIDAAALHRWNALFARAWPADRYYIQRRLAQELNTRLTALTANAGLVQTVHPVTLDMDAPPALTSSSPSELSILAPAAPGTWSAATTVELGTTVQTQVLGVPISTTVLFDVSVEVKDIRLVAPMEFDLTDPRRPQLVRSGTPQVQMTIVVSSQSPLLGTVSQALTQVLDPVVRAALTLGAGWIQAQVTGAVGVIPNQPFGLGGPGVQPVSPTADLAALADDVGAEILRNHLPFGTLLTTYFDQPGFGNGAPVRYGTYGDSTIWTGFYLMAEAVHHDLTGSAQALAGAQRAAEGLEDCLDVAAVDGRLHRCVVPAGSPHIADIQSGIDFSWGTVDGVPHGSEGDISRDQYLGVYMGFTAAYLRVPELRDLSRRSLTRMTDYLNRTGWYAHQTDNVTPARARYAFNPDVAWTCIKSAYMADPARWAGLHDPNRAMASVYWLNAWATSREVMTGYYGFNLGHTGIAIMAMAETDPVLYREYVKPLEIFRDVVGHHLNAWFDVLYPMIVPSAAPVWGPVVEGELQCWSLRDRRAKRVDLRNDPTIQKVTYTSPLIGISNVNAALSGSQSVTVAAHPVPIEKRVYGSFLWSWHPFQLRSWSGDPTWQPSGMELLLPYWIGRSYGLVR
jgi:hypothetical protein